MWTKLFFVERASAVPKLMSIIFSSSYVFPINVCSFLKVKDGVSLILSMFHAVR